jgi:NCS1 family nucleobase:cation symporter-1
MHTPGNGTADLSHLPPDVRSSPLINADLAPVPPERRTWTTYTFAALWISMAASWRSG